jgi:hypothetical protein
LKINYKNTPVLLEYSPNRVRGPILLILKDVVNSLVTNITLSGAQYVNNSCLCGDCKNKEFLNQCNATILDTVQ